MLHTFRSFQPWDPFVELSRLQEEASRAATARRSESSASFVPAVDIIEEKDAILVRADLPGVNPEAVQITVEQEVLTLSGERRFDREFERDGAHRIESGFGKFSRSFKLPTNVAADSIEATSLHGVLTIRVPKRAAAQTRKIAVKVGGAATTIEPTKAEARA